MNRFVPFLSVLPVTLLWSLAALPAERDFGCAPRPGPHAIDMPRMLTIVKGEVVSEGPEADLGAMADTLDISLSEIVCWRAAERLFRVRVWLGVVSIVTKPDPLTLMKNYLKSLAAAQEAYFVGHDAYADDLAALTPVEPGLRITIDLSRVEDGWRARAHHEWVNHECVVFVGSPPTVYDRGRRVTGAELRENEPACYSQHNHGR